MVTFTPNGKHILASYHEDKCLSLLSPSTCDQVREYQLTEHPYGVACSSSGSFMACGTASGSVLLIDTKSGLERELKGGHTGVAWSVAISNDEKFVVSGGGTNDKKMCVWNVSDYQLLYTNTDHTDIIWQMLVTPDNNTIISCSSDRTIRTWSIRTGKPLHTIIGHSNSVYSIALTPDGKQLLSASRDKTVKVWSLATGENLQTLTCHDGPVYAVTASADGQYAISGSADKTIKIWELATGECVQTISHHTIWVRQLAMSPNGQHMVSADVGGNLCLWRCSDIIQVLLFLFPFHP